MSYDFIIVGTGAGGSVLANRLSASGDHNVLVLEAGVSDWDPMHRIPKGFYFTMANPVNSNPITTEPFGDGTVETWQRGWLTGGSTTINGWVWNRGDSVAYESWAERSNGLWNYKRFVDAWKHIESHEDGANDVRGGNGPVSVEKAKVDSPVSEAVMDAIEKTGATRVDDMNGIQTDRVGPPSSTTKRGFRQSAARAFLHPVLKRKNLTLRNNAEVRRVIFSGKTAIGVEIEHKGKLETILARREVILAGGALGSPQILERSGIGNPKTLEAASVEVVAASPQVGENLSEHRGIMFQYRFNGTVGFNHQINTKLRQLITGVKYLATGSGVLSVGGYDAQAVYRSDPSNEFPDTQFLFTPISTTASKPQDGGMVVDDFSGGMVVAYPLYPTSRGSIHITGPHVGDKPELIPNYLDTDHDRKLVVAMTRKIREFMASPEMKAFGVEELQPGLNKMETDEQILDYVLNVGANAYHPLGTCQLGTSSEDVVDERLRVRGVNGLRVVDASVFPGQPSGNNSAPTQAAAWIAADLILEDAETS